MKLPYRLGVGIVLFNKQGKVWVGNRIINNNFMNKESSWQFPQGGIDDGETAEQAAKRELYEETCIKNIKLLEQAPQILSYDFPSELQKLKICKKYCGQKQYWFAYLFTGAESEICVNKVPLGANPEFSEWQWIGFKETINLIVDFKKPTYIQLYNIFKKYETTNM